MLMFEHPPCDDVVVDVHLPLLDPSTTNIEAMADRVRPACPICKEPMRFAAWNFSDTDEGSEPPSAAPLPSEHRPRINLGAAPIGGCTCGWQTPPNTTDSDDAFSEHLAIIEAGGRP